MVRKPTYEELTDRVQILEQITLNHRNVEDDLSHQTKTFDLLINIATSCIKVQLDKMDEAILSALEQIGKIVSADRAYIFKYDFKNNIAINTFEWCNKSVEPQIKNLQNSPLEGCSDFVEPHLKGETVIIRDVSALPSGAVRDIFEQQNIKSLIAVPLFLQKRLIGFTGFDSTKIIDAYSNGEIEILQFFAQILINLKMRAQSEKALQKRDKKYSLLIKSMSDVIIQISANGKLLYISPNMKKFGGYDPKKEIGNDISKYFENDADIIRAVELFGKISITHENVSFGNGADIMQTVKLLEKALTNSKSDNFEFLFKPKNKKPFPVEYTYSPVLKNNKVTAIQLVLRDISERKQAEQELKYSKLQFEAVLNNLDSGIYITDIESHEILFMNNFMKNEFGKDFTGNICWKSFYDNQKGPCEFCTNDKLIDTHGNSTGLYIWEIYNQKVNKWYELHDQAIPWTDGRLVHMEIAFDITDRKQAEKQVQNSVDEKVVLLREIHHRVKNNMQVIVSLLRMHSKRTRDEHLGKVFEDCRDRINAMSLIHESLYQSDDLARIDFKIYLKKLCRNLSRVYDATGQGIRLQVEECNVMLNMDQGIAIGMVIAELISNAFKHAFPLGKGGNVSVSLSSDDGKVAQLIIQDDGKGILPKIDILNSSSLGLKLAVAAVTRELDGSIKVDRRNGTKFVIHFKYKTGRSV